VSRVRHAGLRWKLVLALVATSAATLGVVVAALLPPLQDRLAADRLDSMRVLAGTARLALARLPARDVRPGAPGPARIARDLQRRAGGHVTLLDGSGRVMVDTDPDRRASEVATASAAAGLDRSGDMRLGVLGTEAVVVTPVRARGRSLTLVLRKSLDDSRAAASVVRRALPLAAGAGLAIALLLGIVLS
jgi:hypothetical protein